MITYRQLRYLSALAEHRHFGRAAQACAITQPALSMQIRDLEKELGSQLVERRPGEMVLTDIGAEVAYRGERILAATRDLVDFARHRQLLSGRLSLGVIPTLAPYILPKILPVVQRRFPDLRLELRETQTKGLVEELTRGSLDVVMLALPVTAGVEIETVPLFDDPFLLAVPADDPRPDEARVTAGDIDPRRLILLEEGHCLRDQALDYCAKPRQENVLGLGATSLATVMQMVASGYGITLVPQVAVDVEVRDERVKLLRFASPQPGRTVGLAWRQTSPRKVDFIALGQLMAEAIGVRDEKRPALARRVTE